MRLQGALKLKILKRSIEALRVYAFRRNLPAIRENLGDYEIFFLTAFDNVPYPKRPLIHYPNRRYCQRTHLTLHRKYFVKFAEKTKFRSTIC